MANLEEKVKDKIEPTIEQLGYELYDVEYVKEGKDYFLRVYIDKETGIDLEDCEQVSNAINPILDEEDIIKEQYFLEVSSPGIERRLRTEKHFEENMGKEVEIKLFTPIDGKKIYDGILEKVTKEDIYLKENESIKLPRKNIALVKTIYHWEKE